jgi:hypothetical protein
MTTKRDKIMLHMKWNFNKQGRLCATWVKTAQLPEQQQNDKQLLEELRLVNNLYNSLDAVFMSVTHK